MLTRPEVQRYSAESGLRDMMIAEKEVVLTFLLELLSSRGILDRLAFKGGTCLRKMLIGSQARFSTDLDFTGIEDHDHEAIILDMMSAFQEPFHGIDGSGQSEVKIQISRRETPTLATERRRQCEQSYFKLLAFAPTQITCLALPKILAEKIRACYQRNKARDIYDLGCSLPGHSTGR